MVQPITSDVPDQLPVGEGQNGTAPVAQPVDNAVAPPQPAPQAQAPQPPADPLASHPAVQQAGVLRRIGETLAGGPTVKTTIDPNTGVVTREKEPLDTKHMLLGLLANVLGGAGQIASNTSARMAGRAPAPIQPLPTQVAQQQRDAQSNEDFDRIQQQKVRQAKVLEANMNAVKTAYGLRHEANESLDKYIALHGPQLEDAQKSGIVEASNIPSSQIMSKGFDPSKYVSVPDGHAPVYDKNGQQVTDKNGVPVEELTYSVYNGQTQMPLSQEKYDQFAKYGLMQSKEGFKLPEGATVTGATLAMMNNKLGLIDQTQRELNEVHDAVGGDKVDLAEQIKKNPQMLTALQVFHNDATSTEPDNQINNMTASQDPKVRGAAGLMRELFGNQNLEKFKEDRLARTKAEATKQEETARLGAKAASPEGQLDTQIKQAQLDKLQKDIKDKGGIDFSKINTTPIDGVTFQPDPNYPVNQDVLAGLEQQDPGLAASVKAIGEARELMTPQAQRTKDGQQIMKAVNLAYPKYNAAKVDTYFKGRDKGTSGSLGSKVNSFATAMDHLQRYYDNISTLAVTPGVNTIAELLGNEKAKAFETDKTALASEIATAYAQGAGTGVDREKWEKALGGGTIYSAQNGAKETAKLLHGKFSEYANQYRNMVPGGLKDDNFLLMSDNAAKAYQHVTGEKVGNTQPFTSGQQQPQGGKPTVANKQAMLQSITLPGGGHPADIAYAKDGSLLIWSGKAGDGWVPLSGQPAQAPKQ